MRKFLASASLLLISAAASISTVSAAPVHYTINFTTDSGPAPTGSFTYDDAVPVFTDFLVTWDSIQYDLTPDANAPSISGPPACIGSATGAAATFLLMSGSCASTAVWQGAPFNPSSFSFHALFFSGQTFTLIDISGEGPSGPIELGSGSWTITADSVPEPSTLALTAIAGALLTARRRFRR